MCMQSCFISGAAGFVLVVRFQTFKVKLFKKSTEFSKALFISSGESGCSSEEFERMFVLRYQ